MKGKVVEDFGYPMIEIDSMEKIPMVSREEIEKGVDRRLNNREVLS